MSRAEEIKQASEGEASVLKVDFDRGRLDSVLSDLRELDRGLARGRRKELVDLKEILSSFSESLRDLRATGTDFNSFDVLRIGRREYVHSNVLRWLLDPRETHGLSVRFLNRVLDRAGLPTCPEDARAACRVEREVAGPQSIVDLVVETPHALLVIENKIDSVEGEEQTRREYEDFEPRKRERRFGGLLLSPGGTPPEDQRFRALSYRALLEVLLDLEPAGRAAAFVEDYRGLIKGSIARGATMGEFKGFGEKAAFVFSRYADVALVREAIEEAERELQDLLATLVRDLAERDWWDENWTAEPSAGAVYAWRKGWGTGEECFFVGVEGVTLEAFGDEPCASSYMCVPPKMKRADGLYERLREVAVTIDPNSRSSKRTPFWRYLEFADLRPDPSKLRERLLLEFDFLSRFAPVIDGIVAAGRARP